MEIEKIKKVLIKAGCPERLMQMPAIVERINEFVNYKFMTENDLANSISVNNGKVVLDFGQYKMYFKETPSGAEYKFSDNSTNSIEADINQYGMDATAKYIYCGYDMSDFASATFSRTDEGTVEEEYSGFVFSDKKKLDKGEPVLIDSGVVLHKGGKPESLGQNNWKKNEKYLTATYPLTKEFFEKKAKQKETSKYSELLEAERTIAELEQKLEEANAENTKLRQMLAKAMSAYEEQEQSTPKTVRTEDDGERL